MLKISNNIIKKSIKESFFNDKSSREIRKWIIENIKFKNSIPYRKASYAVMNPTDFCPVGCPHCMYSSHKLKKSKIDKKLMNSFVKIANQAKLKMFVFSGGGEPFENLEQMLRAIENIKSLKDVIIISSGYFAKSSETAKNILDKIYNAANTKRKRKNFGKVIITLRISRDSSQCRVIPLENLVNIINWAIDKNDPSKIRILIRTILSYEENEDLKLAEKLNFNLLPEKDKKHIYKNLPIIDGLPTRWLINKKIEIPVIYKPLYFMGRAKNKSARNKYSLWKIIQSEKKSGTPFNLCIRGPKGEGHNYYETILNGYYFWKRNIKKIIYDTPKYKIRKELALYIPASGNILINNGVPDIAPNLNKIKNWPQFLKIIYNDPIQRLLIEKGPFFIKSIAEEVERNLSMKIEKTNFVFAISLFSLKTSSLRLYVTLRTLQYYYKKNQLKINKPLIRKLVEINRKYYINLYNKWGDRFSDKIIEKPFIDPITGDALSLF